MDQIKKVIPQISQQQIREELTSHPSYQGLKGEYKIDSAGLQRFDQAFMERINNKIIEIERLYRK